MLEKSSLNRQVLVTAGCRLGAPALHSRLMLMYSMYANWVFSFIFIHFWILQNKQFRIQQLATKLYQVSLFLKECWIFFPTLSMEHLLLYFFPSG